MLLAQGLRVALCTALIVLACTPPTPPPTTQRPPTVPPTATATAEAVDTTVETVPCAEAEAEASEPEAYVAEIPERPVGAGQIETEELNPGKVPVTPVDPDAAIDLGVDGQQAVIEPPPIGARDQPGDVIAFNTTSIHGASQQSEPNVAVNGRSSFMTWNWFAARSIDGGRAELTNPENQFLNADRTVVDGGFCCDQLVIYVPGHDLWLWILQSSTPRGDPRAGTHIGGNRIRLKVAHGNGPFTGTYDFHSYDAGLGDPLFDPWFDQSKIGITDGHFFLSVNAYTWEENNIASVVYRVPLADLAADRNAQPICFTTLDKRNAHGNPIFGPVPVRKAGDTMYLAAHFDNSKLGVWRWPDDSPTPTFHLVLTSLNGSPPAYFTPTRIVNGRSVYDYHCRRGQTAPSNTDWCAKSDDRISTAWLGNELGFAWNLGQHPGYHDYPMVQVIGLHEDRLAQCGQGECVASKFRIANESYAFQYAAIAPNSRGDLGLVVLYGGGTLRPSCGLGARDSGAGPEANFDFSSRAFYTSDRETAEPRWGDYLGITAGPTDGSWVAGCMSLHSSNTGFDRPASVQFPYFGRRSDSP